jgi:hypothetical protein
MVAGVRKSGDKSIPKLFTKKTQIESKTPKSKPNPNPKHPKPPNQFF